MRIVCLHELTHDLFDRNFGWSPPWLSEGWAQYYSTVRVEGEYVVAGEPLPDMSFTFEPNYFVSRASDGKEVLAVPTHVVTPPSQLLRMDRSAFYSFLHAADEDAFDEAFPRYTGSWAFVHMLLDGPAPYPGRFEAFLRDGVKGSRLDVAWEKAFAALPTTRIDRDFAAYLAKNQVGIQRVRYRSPGPSQTTRRPLTDEEVHVLWARLAGWTDGAADSIARDLDEAVARAPEWPDARYYRGAFHLEASRFQAAEKDLLAAVRLAPKDSRFRHGIAVRSGSDRSRRAGRLRQARSTRTGDTTSRSKQRSEPSRSCPTPPRMRPARWRRDSRLIERGGGPRSRSRRSPGRNLADFRLARYRAGMKVPGYLRLTTLGDVLGGIFREGASGVLELAETYGARAGMVHRVHLVSGAVVHVESAFTGTRLGDVLLQRGLIDPARLRRCEAQLTVSSGVRFGDLLLQSRALSELALSEALRIQRNERLERLFELTDARLSFHVARIHPCRDALSPPSVLHGRKRYRDRAGPPTRREPVRTARHDEGHAATHREGHVAIRRDPARTRALSTLGLDAAADSTTVKRAFRDLARSLHPDCHPTASLTERAELMRRFAEITAAYHALVA